MSTPRSLDQDTLKPEGFKPQPGSLMLSTLAINILSLALPVMTLQVYNRILPNPGSGTLSMLITGVCVAVFLEAVLRLARAYMLGWSGAVFEHRLSCAAMNRILQSDLSQAGSFGIGEHLHRMTAIGKLKDFYNGYAFMTLFELAFVPLFLVLTLYIAGPLAFVPAAVLMVFTVVSLAQGQKMRAALRVRDQTDDERYNFLIEGLEGIHTVKSFALENVFARRYETLEEASTLANYDVTEATAGTFNAAAIFSHLMVAAVISVGALLVLQGEISTGALIATILLSGRMMQPIQRTLVLWAKYQDYALARAKVETIFEAPLYVPVANDRKPQKEGTLRLENVSLRYGDHSPFVLKNVNLSLKRGEVIMLSAASSSTAIRPLLDMICGIYPPTDGSIIIDGQNVACYQPEELIHHVGYIQTEGLIFRGTIRDNMTCFGQIEEKKVQEIAALLKVDREIAKLPGGFDTFLSGNNTDSVPPGLKQRIAIVRILAPKPRLILFNNADRGLDREGYNLVHSMLARLKGKASMILISDDQNMHKLVDRFLTIEDGMLKEAGANNFQSSQNFKSYRELQF